MRRHIKFLVLSLCLIFVSASAYAVEFGDVSTGNSVAIHGYISQGYLKSIDNNFYGETNEGGTADFSEAAFNIGTDVSDKLHIGMQILSRKLGDFGKGKVEIDWGYADYRYKDWLGIRAGKMKLVHGLYNETRDVDFLRTSIFLPQSIYNEAWRDTVAAVQGAELYGDVYLGMAGSLNYRLQGGDCAYPVDSGVATTTEDQARLLGMEYDAKDYFSKYGASSALVWTTPIDGLRLSLTGWVIEFKLEGDATALPGLSATTGGAIKSGQALGQVDVQTRSAEWTGSLEYTIGDLVIAGEYSINDYDFWNTVYGPQLQAIVGTEPTHSTLSTEGYYGSLTYRFTDWFEAGTYYSVYYADRDDKDGELNKSGARAANGYHDYDSWLKDLALSLKFNVTDNWVFKLEGHKMNGAAILTKSVNTLPSTGKLDTTEDWYLYAMKLTFSF